MIGGGQGRRFSALLLLLWMSRDSGIRSRLRPRVLEGFECWIFLCLGSLLPLFEDFAKVGGGKDGLFLMSFSCMVLCVCV